MTDKSLHPELGSGALREALAKLSNEASGMLGLSGVREAIGNTNMACLQLRVDEARALLSLSSPIEPPPTVSVGTHCTGAFPCPMHPHLSGGHPVVSGVYEIAQASSDDEPGAARGSERGSVSEIIDVLVLWYMLFSGLAILMLAFMGPGRRQERER